MDAAREAVDPVHGEVVEFFGFQYDVWGTAVGTQWESWSAKRLPKRHDAMATHTNGGESVLTREDAIAWCMKEAWHRHIAVTVHARHPALHGPHRFSMEPVFELLEPQYERVIWMGKEWRLHTLKPGGKKSWLSGPHTPPNGIADGLPRAHNLHMMRGGSLSGALHPLTVRLLGAAPPRTQCAMCAPRYSSDLRRVRVGLAGRPEVDEPLCLHHVLGYFVSFDEQRRMHELEGPWMQWRDRLHDLMYEDAQAAEEGRAIPGVRRRWLALLDRPVTTPQSGDVPALAA
ncbi:hypothetical protein [Streptomyces ehimensis]|uniref:Uncharacterized protein n=1 Tax=Streptomyces ehimensis TaxID=68195 RepID=A0ABV9BDJ1_9ACTN